MLMAKSSCGGCDGAHGGEIVPSGSQCPHPPFLSPPPELSHPSGMWAKCKEIGCGKKMLMEILG